MTDQEKLRILQLDEKSDYSRWRIRVLAAISAKKLNYSMADMAVDADQETYKDKQQLASHIIVATLSNKSPVRGPQGHTVATGDDEEAIRALRLEEHCVKIFQDVRTGLYQVHQSQG